MTTIADATTARTVAFSAVLDYTAPILESAGSWPMVGTIAWQRADDEVKLAAIADAARHWALYVENNQAVMAEASHAIAGAADWQSVARRIHQQRGAAYIPRERAS